MLGTLKDEHDDRRQNERAAKNNGTDLPRHFTLAGSRVDPLHNSKDVNRGKDVKDLEDDVPRHTLPEQIEVSGAEDQSVEHLGNKGDTLCAAVSVDGEDEDTFREGVGQVAQNTEELQNVSQSLMFGVVVSQRTFHAPIVKGGLLKSEL